MPYASRPYASRPYAAESWLTDTIRERLRQDEVRADVWRDTYPRWWELIRDASVDFRLRITRFDPSFTAEVLSEGEREMFVIRTAELVSLTWVATGHYADISGDSVDVLDQATMFVCLMICGMADGFRTRLAPTYSWLPRSGE
jgi:hypothetical protein